MLICIVSKKTMKKLLPLIFLIFAFTTFGQNSDCPNTKYTTNGVFKVTDLNSDLASDFTCFKDVMTGTITGLGYADDDDDQVQLFTFQLPNGAREIITISDDDDFYDCFSEADKGNWKARLVKKARVKITVWRCGAGGKSDPVLQSIEFLPIRIRKKR